MASGNRAISYCSIKNVNEDANGDTNEPVQTSYSNRHVKSVSLSVNRHRGYTQEHFLENKQYLNYLEQRYFEFVDDLRAVWKATRSMRYCVTPTDSCRPRRESSVVESTIVPVKNKTRKKFTIRARWRSGRPNVRMKNK